MDNVIEFPTKTVRDWAIIERAIITELRNFRVSTAVEDRILEQVRNTYNLLDDFNFSAPIEFPGTIPADQVAGICSGIGEKISAALKEHLHAMTTRILIDRLNREVDVCKQFGLI